MSGCLPRFFSVCWSQQLWHALIWFFLFICIFRTCLPPCRYFDVSVLLSTFRFPGFSGICSCRSVIEPCEASTPFISNIFPCTAALFSGLLTTEHVYFFLPQAFSFQISSLPQLRRKLGLVYCSPFVYLLCFLLAAAVRLFFSRPQGLTYRLCPKPYSYTSTGIDTAALVKVGCSVQKSKSPSSAQKSNQLICSLFPRWYDEQSRQSGTRRDWIYPRKTFPSGK